MKCAFCRRPAVGRVHIRMTMPYFDRKVAKEMTLEIDRAVCGHHHAEFARATPSGIPKFAWKLSE